MADLNKSYRIRTDVNDTEKDNVGVVNVHLDQTYDMLEILSLKLDQKNEYKFYESTYGVVVGRVQANGGFGIENAKVSIFIAVDDTASLKERLKYNFDSTQRQDNDGVRYNLLPNEVDSACHQDVGTFPNKRFLLDNDDQIEIFEKYWKYTTTTNAAGDYMLFGIPTGSQSLHVDVDLSDCGILSQKPTDMIYKGYPAKMFDSPTKFKKSTDLNSLAQIYSQDKGIYVYPYWGETSNSDGQNLAITRCDINLTYKFEPTCVFIGSVITDKGNNAIGKNCAGTDSVGKMSDLSAGEGSIEMIRKTMDNKVEVYQIQGDRLIDGDGVWCYQIPMNLDYVRTDEYGNLVPTDDPEKGIPTRTRVRFRISLDEQPSDGSARKRCRYLVPNNPRLDDEGFRENLEADYEFGSATREESFVDLFWNKVYTVKNYIPRFQKNKKPTNRKFTGIKLINYFGDNNPMPYNSLSIKLSFMYRLICVLVKIIIYIIAFINTMISLLSSIGCMIVKALKAMSLNIMGICITCVITKPLIAIFDLMIIKCIELSSEFCDDGINQRTYYPGCSGCSWDKTEAAHNKSQKGLPEEDWTIADPNPGVLDSGDDSILFTCVENSLAQENDATSFNFYNDWVNGALYMPLWYRKITPKKSFLFGLFKRKAKDQWCDANKSSNGARLYYPCAVPYSDNKPQYKNYDGKSVTPSTMKDGGCGDSCHETISQISLSNGVILTRTTLTGSTVYYYKAVEFDAKNIQPYNTTYYGSLTDGTGKAINGEVKLLFATDIVLLGSLNSCDLEGIPQFFKKLDNTTYNLPTDILFTDMTWTSSVDEDGNMIVDSDGDQTYQASLNTEMTGCDWGNLNPSDECGKMGKDDDGGLFYSIGCSTIEMKPKSCINLRRICEYGVSLDDAKYIPNLSKLSGSDNDESYDLLIPDGFISYDELYNLDERSMFATMNGNKLKTKLNTTNGLKEYDFRYLYPENFDGALQTIMDKDLPGCSNITYRNNNNLEAFSEDYYRFRMGDKPYYYDKDKRFARYENSYYFYFGLKYGKTAIDKFNSQFFAECEDTNAEYSSIAVSSVGNTWCSELNGVYDGNITIDLTGIATPYDIIINSDSNATIGYSFDGISDEKICFSNEVIEGFTNMTDEEGNNIVLPNGDYTITVTDNDGSISSTSFTMSDEYLTFDVNTVNFQQSENVLKNEFNNGEDTDKYTVIAKCGSSLKLSSDDYEASRTDGKKEEIGGTITIYNIMYNDSQLTKNDISIRIEPTESDENYDESTYPWTSGGSTIGDTISKWDGNVFMSKVGKGDQRYKITVTQLCNGVESNNSISKTVTISNPIPFQMYVGGVDYMLFKDWELGYSHNSISRVNTNGAEPAEWLSLSNTDNYQWENSIDYNNFIILLEEADTAEDMSLAVKKYCSNLPDDFTETLQGYFDTNDSDDVKKTNAREYCKDVYKSDTITKAKSVFWVTCPKRGNDIAVTVKTSDLPYNVRLCYQLEEYNNDEEINVLSSGDYEYVDDNMFEDVMIPTITTKDNENYGGGKDVPGHEDELVYGKDNINTKKYRKPLFVAVSNGKKKTLPSDIGVDDEGFPAETLSKYVGFHLIDKTFTSNLLAWAYINEIPYFFGEYDSTDGYGKNEEKAGQSVTASGLLAGYIYNGIPSNENKESTVFDEQTLGNKTIKISTYGDEDDIPTKRIINGENTKEYIDYYIQDITYGYYQYASVKNSQLALTISDTNGCTIDDTIYGNMNIKLSDTSEQGNGQANLFLTAGVSNLDVIYYIIHLEDVNAYPINSFILPPDDGNYTINIDSDNEWKNNVDTVETFFNFKTTKDIIADKSDKNKSNVFGKSTNEEDPTKIDVTNGYSTTGFFYVRKQRYYYVIAVSGNNCRAISPVYDCYNISVNAGLKTDSGNKILYFTINKPEDRYYIKNFSFDTNVTVSTNTPFEGSLTIEKTDIDITDPADDGYKEGDDVLAWLESLPENKRENTYSFETKNETTGESSYAIYSYVDDWVIGDPTTDVTGYTPLGEGTYYYQTSNGGYVEVTVYADGTASFSDESEEKPSEATSLEDSGKYYYISGTETVPNEDGTSSTVTYYSTLEHYTGWRELMTMEDDPLIAHYEKEIQYIISDSTYNTLKGYAKWKNIFIKYVKFYITDKVGLRHLCSIDKIIT